MNGPCVVMKMDFSPEREVVAMAGEETMGASLCDVHCSEKSMSHEGICMEENVIKQLQLCGLLCPKVMFTYSGGGQVVDGRGLQRHRQRLSAVEGLVGLGFEVMRNDLPDVSLRS